MLLGIQIVGIIFGLFMMYLTFLGFKRKELSNLEYLFWTISWLLLLFVTLFPNSLDFLVKRVLSMKRPLDFFIVLGFLFLTFITFVNYNLLKKSQEKIERVVRRLAIEKAEEEKNEKR